jgi:SAM-dependent methyltransferase
MAEPLFDLSAEYEVMLNRGIRLSGEDREFFVRGRAASLVRRLPAGFRMQRILDYGCGTGGTAAYLAELFPDAEVVGVDTSSNALEYAGSHFGRRRIAFAPLDDLPHQGEFDLCYVNGVFHHIPLELRSAAAAGIHRALRPGGRLALFENNPWNFGTRMVMARIPFDRDARTLSPPVAKRLLRASGFVERIEFWSLFYFPRQLRALRSLEGALAVFPFGAQYCVLGTR